MRVVSSGISEYKIKLRYTSLSHYFVLDKDNQNGLKIHGKVIRLLKKSNSYLYIDLPKGLSLILRK